MLFADGHLLWKVPSDGNALPEALFEQGATPDSHSLDANQSFSLKVQLVVLVVRNFLS